MLLWHGYFQGIFERQDTALTATTGSSSRPGTDHSKSNKTVTPSEHVQTEAEEEEEEEPSQTKQPVQQIEREQEEEPGYTTQHKEMSPELEHDATVKSETPGSGKISLLSRCYQNLPGNSFFSVFEYSVHRKLETK